ncbi:DNA primase [Desulfogranum japonicum]|uniref:DNA primase n=1 Tax=Desulfogranum japonicum TaxID=231447 RepID=UPI000400FDC6|nr:DNA primase [Desulfogranum japonicum]
MEVGPINEHIKDQVREAADIVEVVGENVELRKAGNRYVGLCPFHNEKTPSFSVNPQAQFFYCFGCGESGDVFSFMMKYHHCDFPEALRKLAQKYHIDMPKRQMTEQEKKRLKIKENLYGACEEATRLYEQCLVSGKEAAVAQAYLEQRGVPSEFIKRYRLGFAPSPQAVGWAFQTQALQKKSIATDILEQAGLSVKKERGGYYDRFRSRIMFPIFDMTGQVVAFGGRILGDGKPKYMNSPESPVFEKSRLLFGLYQHREAIRQKRTAIVVEGNFDLLMLAVHGVDNVVAPLGTSLTPHHVRQMRSYCDQAVLLFDADTAGLKAAMRSVPYFLAESLECRIALLPEGHDPDSFVREAGPAGIQQRVEQARPLAEFVFDTLVKEYGLTLSGKAKIVEDLKPLLRDAKDSTQRSLMKAHFSEKLGTDLSLFEDGGKTLPATVPIPEPRVIPNNLQKKERQLFEFLLLHPECYQDLAEAGLTAVIEGGVAVQLLEILEKFCLEDAPDPERIFELTTDESVRSSIADLLTSVSVYADPEDGDSVKASMLKELLHWIEEVNYQKNGNVLQQQINEAERTGDLSLLMELLNKKMLLGKKRKGY